MRLKTVALSLMVTLATLSCQKYDDWRFREFTGLAEEFVEAAMHADTAALELLSAEDVPVQRALLIGRLEPDLWQSASGHLSVRFGALVADTATVDFGFPYDGYVESLGMQFVKIDREWKVRHVQLTNRI